MLCICGCGDVHLSELFISGEGAIEVTGVPLDVQEMIWLDPEAEKSKLLALERGEILLPQPDWVADAIRFRICKATQQRVYYTEYIDAAGIAIIGNSDVPDEALLVARYIVLKMTAKRPEIREFLQTKTWGYYTVLASVRESFRELPEYSCSTEEREIYYSCGLAPGSWNARWNVTSINTEGCGDWKRTFVHEFAHSIEQVISSYHEKRVGVRYGNYYYEVAVPLETLNFRVRLEAAYQQAIEKGTWKGSYGETNVREYWAEGVTIWYFGSSPLTTDLQFETHAAFALHDPLLYALLSEWFHEERF
jgi:hypothetical protein